MKLLLSVGIQLVHVLAGEKKSLWEIQHILLKSASPLSISRSHVGVQTPLGLMELTTVLE